MDIYTAIYNMFKQLNTDFLSDLEKYCIDYSDGRHKLKEAIEKYSGLPIDENITAYIEDLNNNKSISAMTEYYEFIETMIDAI